MATTKTTKKEKLNRNFFKETITKENGETITKFIVHYNNEFIASKRTFETFEDAEMYRRLCEDFLNKARFERLDKVKASKSNVKEFSEYPENLLYDLGVKPNDDFPNYYDEIVPNFDNNLQKLHDSFSPKELECLLLRYKYFKTLEQIGKQYNICRERVRQILHKCVAKLKHPNRLKVITTNENELELIAKKEKLVLEEAIKIVSENGYTVSKKEETKIEDLNFTTRTLYCLKRSGIKYLNELISMTKEDLSKIRGIGSKTRKEIEDKISYLKETNLHKNH